MHSATLNTLAMAAVLLICGPTVCAQSNDSEQERAISSIEKLGGRVEVDDKSPGRPVIKVELHGRKVTDADLEILKALPQLRTLYLNSTGITDAGLKHVKGLTQLERLGLGWTQVGDAGLEQLKDLTKLQRLVLDNTKVTDAGVKHLKGLTDLEYLNL